MASDRGQVLDGIMRYGDEIVVVLESKLYGPADDRQARNINLHGQPIAFDGQIRRISWRDVLAAFTDLANEERSLISGAEQVILTDFLAFISANFPQLGPFNTLRRCEGEGSRTTRRLQSILAHVLGGEPTRLPGTHSTVTNAYLTYVDRQVRLRMYPADTLQQARAFYSRPNAVERVLILQTQGWRVLPNFHFGFMAKGFCWTKTTAPVAEYAAYWQKTISSTGQIERKDWNKYWRELVNARVVDSADREEFDDSFTRTSRTSASPRPGICCEFVWSIEDAERLDDSELLTRAAKERINQLLHSLGEDMIGEE
ncbi:MAG: hypothetical protein ACKVRO_15965 [Micropepsaceae bacterium]